MSSEQDKYILEGYAPQTEVEPPVEEPQEEKEPEDEKNGKGRKVFIAIVAILAAIIIILALLFLLRSCSRTAEPAPQPASQAVSTVNFSSDDLEHVILGDTIDYKDFTVTTSRPVDTTDPSADFTCTNINVTVKNNGSTTQAIDWDQAWLGVTESGEQMNTSWMITSGFSDQDISVTRIEPGASIGASIVVAPTQAGQVFYALIFSPVPSEDGHAQGVYWTSY